MDITISHDPFAPEGTLPETDISQRLVHGVGIVDVTASDDYDDLTAKELKARVKARDDVTVQGRQTKDNLIAALRAADAAQAAEEDTVDDFPVGRLAEAGATPEELEVIVDSFNASTPEEQVGTIERYRAIGHGDLVEQLAQWRADGYFGDEVPGPYDGVPFKDLEEQVKSRGIEYEGRLSTARAIEMLTAKDAADAETTGDEGQSGD